jgi:endoglucanase
MKILKIFMSLLPFTASSQIRGVNFYGIETPLGDTTCSWKYPLSYYLDFLVEQGFNSIRLPFSYEYVKTSNLHSLDNFVNYGSYKNMSILLDFHRVHTHYQSGNPFDDISIQEFVECWTTLLDRYVNNTSVYGLGLFNEYQGIDGKYWSEIMKQVIDKIELTQPKDRWIYLVGGTQWGGNLEDINLEGLPYSNRIRYEIHKYHFSGKPPNDWDLTFGKFKDKVIVGEWSINRDDWDDLFISYLLKNNITDNYYWTISNSYDTINIWRDDCETINYDVLTKIKKLW